MRKKALLRRLVDHKYGGMSGVGVHVVNYDCRSYYERHHFSG